MWGTLVPLFQRQNLIVWVASPWIIPPPPTRLEVSQTNTNGYVVCAHCLFHFLWFQTLLLSYDIPNLCSCSLYLDSAFLPHVLTRPFFWISWLALDIIITSACSHMDCSWHHTLWLWARFTGHFLHPATLSQPQPGLALTQERLDNFKIAI